eukprot:12861887-Ditylum_brightwellii.AAC.1
MTSMQHALNFAKLCVNGLSNKKKSWEYDALRPYFGWKPVKAHNGSTCAQLYCGRKSLLTNIFGMKTESQMPNALMDFIRKWGAMKGLFSDYTNAQTSLAIKDVLYQYSIDDMQSEPHQQN